MFTAGIGENSAALRERVCRDAAWLGVELDADANASDGAAHQHAGEPRLGVGHSDQRGADDRPAHAGRAGVVSARAPCARYRWRSAVSAIPDGASLMIGGFMGVGTPERLIDELCRQGRRDLTVIANDTARPGVGIGKLVTQRVVRKVIVSHIGPTRKRSSRC